MHDDQYSKPCAQTQEYKAILIGRVIWVIKQQRVLVCKDTLGFFKRDTVLPFVGPALRRVGVKAEVGHMIMYIQGMYLASQKEMRRGLTDRA